MKTSTKIGISIASVIAAAGASYAGKLIYDKKKNKQKPKEVDVSETIEVEVPEITAE